MTLKKYFHLGKKHFSYFFYPNVDNLICQDEAEKKNFSFGVW